jgi:hypothetical protein
VASGSRMRNGETCNFRASRHRELITATMRRAASLTECSLMSEKSIEFEIMQKDAKPWQIWMARNLWG